MNLVLGFFAMLALASMSSAAVKGGRGLLKGGGIGGAVHHTAVVQDPLSGSPVVVETVSNVKGGGGIKGGIKGAGQYALPFGRRLYRNGASAYPFGLLGSDYYSYPASLYTTPRNVLGRKGLISNNLSGLSPIGLSAGGLKGGLVGKGGGIGGAVHHTAVVQDPVSGSPVVVETVSNVKGGGGIKGGIKGAGQYALPFGRRLYRNGASAYPYGLLGSDYYSYPASLYTTPRNVLGRKGLISNNLSGLSPIGLSAGGLKGGVIADPAISQFSLGDAQIKTSVFGGNRNLYRTGVSAVPYGLMGLDYYSYPRQLLTQQRLLSDGFGLSQSPLGGGSLFTAGDSQISGGALDIGQEKVTVVETDPLSGGQRVTTTVQRPSGIKGGNILLTGQGIGGLRQFGARPSVVVAQSPISQVKTSAGGLLGRSLFGNPQLIYTDGGRRFPGIYSFGGSRIGDPRLGYNQLPISTSPFANLGGFSSLKTSPIAKGLGGQVLASPFAAAPSTVVQQEEVVNPITGQVSQITTTQELAQSPLSQSPLSQAQVTETSYSDPATGTVTRVTEVSPAGGNLAQQNIADAVVQQSIASGIGGGYDIGSYLPRISLLNQFPYDMPDTQLVRSVISSPVVQQQQDLEQILLK